NPFGFMGVDLIDAVGAISATVASHGHQMKASLTFFILSLLIGANGAHAQQAKRSADEAGGPESSGRQRRNGSGRGRSRWTVGGTPHQSVTVNGSVPIFMRSRPAFLRGSSSGMSATGSPTPRSGSCGSRPDPNRIRPPRGGHKVPRARPFRLRTA